MQEGIKQSPLCTELLHYVRYMNSHVYSPVWNTARERLRAIKFVTMEAELNAYYSSG